MPLFGEPVDRRLLQSLAKKVPEATYMTAQNRSRYRPMMRYFYQQHMGHQYSHSVEDVFAFMRAFVASNYTQELCELDLQQLCEWGNLVAEQDRGGRTVEEFLRRRLRYTITAYGIAFERLLTELEEGKATGGSLDPSLLERLAAQLHGVEAALTRSQAETAEERTHAGPILLPVRYTNCGNRRLKRSTKSGATPATTWGSCIADNTMTWPTLRSSWPTKMYCCSISTVS